MSSGGGGGQFPQYGQNSYGRMGGYGQSYAPDPRMAQFQPMRVQESGAMPSRAGMNSDEMMQQRFMSQNAPRMNNSFASGPAGGWQSGGNILQPSGPSMSGLGRSTNGGDSLSPIGPAYNPMAGGNQTTNGGPMLSPSGGPYNPVVGSRMDSFWQMPQPSGFNPMQGSQMNQPMPTQGPQMSAPYSQEAPQPSGFNPMQGSQMNQPMPTQTPNAAQQRPQQSFEQFAQTLNGSGMTSGQMQDEYQKSIAPQSTNFFGNVGPGGTQNPFPGTSQPFPSNWGAQTFGFDPRSMAGKTVGKDMGWYYGQDAIGRNINNQGDAVAGFRGAADGFNRSRPWLK